MQVFGGGQCFAAEDADAYRSENVFWVPKTARWTFLKEKVRIVEPTIGALVDRAILDIEKANPSLIGVLTKNSAPELDQTRLAEVT